MHVQVPPAPLSFRLVPWRTGERPGLCCMVSEECRLKVVQCSAKKDQNRLNGCSATAVILCIGALRRGKWRRADEDTPHKDVGERPTTLHYPTKIGIILIAVAKIQLVVWRIRSSP